MMVIVNRYEGSCRRLVNINGGFSAK